ncbi:MAG: FG-GAP-like repeat-containing protein [Actinomycetota bacterium]
MKIFKLTICLFVSLFIFLALFSPAALAVDSDFNGDGSDEIAAMYDYPLYCSALWVWSKSGSMMNPTPWWASTYGSWNATNSKVVTGEFNGDAYDDVLALQSYPLSCAALWQFSSNGAGRFTQQAVWASMSGGFNVDLAKIAAGDFDGDGRSEIIALYEYPQSCAALWFFDYDGSKWTCNPIWASASGAFSVPGCQVAAGDFDNDGAAEFSVLQPFPQSCAAIWVFDKGATSWTARPWWASPSGGWNVASSKMVAGDFDGDGIDDLAAQYQYPANCAALWMFKSDGGRFTYTPWWASKSGAWDATKTKLVAGDTDNDTRDELYALYDYPLSCAALWEADSTGYSFNVYPVWASKSGAWDVKKSRLAGGNTFLPVRYPVGGQQIDINLSTQTLLCGETYYGEWREGVFFYDFSPIFSTLVSSGRPPFNTPAGYFSVYAKDPTVDMSGFGGTAEYYYVPNVPYVLWFTGNYSIHGAYWHNDFGNVRSHGCVNVPVDAAAWIYNWAPIGTPVYVHY